MIATLLAAALAAQAPAPAPGVRPGLEPLGFLVGHCWRGIFPDSGEQDTHCFDAVYGGQHVRDRHEVTGGAPYGRVVAFGSFWLAIEHETERAAWLLRLPLSAFEQ